MINSILQMDSTRTDQLVLRDRMNTLCKDCKMYYLQAKITFLDSLGQAFNSFTVKVLTGYNNGTLHLR